MRRDIGLAVTHRSVLVCLIAPFPPYAHLVIKELSSHCYPVFHGFNKLHKETLPNQFRDVISVLYLGTDLPKILPLV